MARAVDERLEPNSGLPATATLAGAGACFAEVGGGEAVEIGGRFLADPPAIVIGAPSADALVAKAAFESQRLAAWFGG